MSAEKESRDFQWSEEPRVGELVCPRNPFWLCSANAAENYDTYEKYKKFGIVGLSSLFGGSEPKWLDKKVILLFLGVQEIIDTSSLLKGPRWVYIFLIDGKVMYSEPTRWKPLAWLSYNLVALKQTDKIWIKDPK